MRADRSIGAVTALVVGAVTALVQSMLVAVGQLRELVTAAKSLKFAIRDPGVEKCPEKVRRRRRKGCSP